MEHEYIDIDMPLRDMVLPLTWRVQNCLRELNIVRIKDLCQKSPLYLLKTRNLGRGSLSEVKDFLGKYGLRLEMDNEDLEEYKKSFFAQRRWGVTNLALFKEQRRWELASQMLIHTKYDCQVILDIVDEFMEKYDKSVGL